MYAELKFAVQKLRFDTIYSIYQLTKNKTLSKLYLLTRQLGIFRELTRARCICTIKTNEIKLSHVVSKLNSRLDFYGFKQMWSLSKNWGWCESCIALVFFIHTWSSLPAVKKKKDIFAQCNCTICEFDLCIELILTLHATRKCLAQGHPSLWPVLRFQPSGSETHSCPHFPAARLKQATVQIKSSKNQQLKHVPKLQNVNTRG